MNSPACARCAKINLTVSDWFRAFWRVSLRNLGQDLKSLAHDLLAAVLDDLGARGVTRVEAFPRCGRHEDGDVWTGPEAIFERVGFRVVRRDERFSVMEKSLE